jgi:hypothetical protein
MSGEKIYRCPHCGEKLLPWRSPDLTTWGGNVQYVCFNDDCSYFREGWEWMATKYNVRASYRHRFDPATGSSGPLPVWDRDALKNQIAGDAPAS